MTGNGIESSSEEPTIVDVQRMEKKKETDPLGGNQQRKRRREGK
jgi:hypothetical protein